MGEGRGVVNFDKIKIKGLFVNLGTTIRITKLKNYVMDNDIAYNIKTIKNMH